MDPLFSPTLKEKRATPVLLHARATTSSYNDDASFVGNTPSTVLFFLALAVGVCIAFLFIFFTVRYFVRSKYGLHVYPLSHRNLMMGQNINLASVMGVGMATESNREIQQQIDYIRTHHFIRGEILQRRIHGRRRRRRRGRYSRMKKLTDEEVELLFPKKTYHDWLNGGKERDHDNRQGVLHEDNDDSYNATTVDTSHNVVTDARSDNSVYEDARQHETDITDQVELEDLEADLHFTSGTCAICLEVLEDDDIVRGLLCGHVFHSECLDPWLVKRRACCPMCKRDYLFEKSGLHSTTGETTEATSNPINSNTPGPSSDPEANDTPSQTPEDRERLARDDASLDDASIDYDAFRSDPTLRAMLQELIPTSERVSFILNSEAVRHLNLEERARAIAKQKYGRFLRIIWWKLMGIKKEDLFNWAVLNLYHESMVQQTETPAEPATPEEARDSVEQRV